MLNVFYYILCIGILSIFIFYAYIRLKYGFWVIQPVFHIYDIKYMFFPPGIIDHSLPKINKYTKLNEIKMICADELTPLKQTKFTNFIKMNYLKNNDNIFSPTSENISPYFVGHSDKSFVSFYYKEVTMIDAHHNLVTDEEMIGAITSRPVNIAIHDNKNKVSNFKAYYIDYLCVDKLSRKKGIAPQLIQTHHYNQSHVNKNIVVSIFKREDELTGIVPLCVYSTYGFNVFTWTKPHNFSGQYTLLEINPQNYRFLYDFISLTSHKFKIVINTDITNILNLLKTKNIFIYAVLCDNEIICCYFYRKSCVQITKGLEVLSCFASICNCEKDIFIKGFKISFWKISAENNFGFCAIENISHNNLLIQNIMLKTEPSIISPTAYFFYNFAYPTFLPEQTLLIN